MSRDLDIKVAKALGWTNIIVHKRSSDEGTQSEWLGGREPDSDLPTNCTPQAAAEAICWAFPECVDAAEGGDA